MVGKDAVQRFDVVKPLCVLIICKPFLSFTSQFGDSSADFRGLRCVISGVKDSACVQSCNYEVLCTQVSDLSVNLADAVVHHARSVLHRSDLPYQRSEQPVLVILELQHHRVEAIVYHILSDSSALTVRGSRCSAGAGPVGCTSCDEPSETATAFGASELSGQWV